MKSKMTQDFFNRLVSRIILQAAKDYINPAPVMRSAILKLDESAEDYNERVAAIYDAHRLQILRDLRSSHMDFLSGGNSVIIADKLEKANLKDLKKKMDEEERRIAFEESLEKHKYDYKVESLV